MQNVQWVAVHVGPIYADAMCDAMAVIRPNQGSKNAAQVMYMLGIRMSYRHQPRAALRTYLIIVRAS